MHRMMKLKCNTFFVPAEAVFPLFILLFVFMQACDEPAPKKQEIVQTPQELKVRISEQIATSISYAADRNGKIDDSIRLVLFPEVTACYESIRNKPVWSILEQWTPSADSLFGFIEQSEQYGLFPSAYHLRHLRSLRNKLTDSAARLDAVLWAKGDLMMTDAFVLMLKHLKQGRLPKDSITLSPDTVLQKEYFTGQLKEIIAGRDPRSVLESAEPQLQVYKDLRLAVRSFLDSMDRTPYTYVVYPNKDSLLFLKQLQSRLFESSYITFNTRPADTTELTEAIKKAQAELKLKVDGKAGPSLIKALNNTDDIKFRRIALNLDRYKMLPDTLPASYVWVNLPAYKMQVWDSGFVVLESKVIIGQPKTRTPVLNSEISNFVTYPQWTVPFSIIIKEMLPQIQKNIEYLKKENLMVVDKYDSVIDPATVTWAKLSKTYFPYTLKQRQGDDNSLGVLKFNFRNKYSVYLHDTNARWLFAKSSRALSHGCVRVKDWDSLARYLIRNDTLRIKADTVKAWLKRQEKHVVSLGQKVPIYIRYITCEAKEGKMVFFDDIYSEDKVLIEKYFMGG